MLLFGEGHVLCPRGCGCLAVRLVDGYHCANCGTHKRPPLSIEEELVDCKMCGQLIPSDGFCIDCDLQRGD
jgi:hypothetical protein